MNPDHEQLFENAKKAQNNIVEEARLKYRQEQDPQTQNDWYDEAVPPENPDALDILSTPDLDAEMDVYKQIVGGSKYTVNPDLSKNQRRQAERTLGKLENLLDTGWVTIG